MVMSVAAPETAARTEVATGGFAAAAPTGLLPSAVWANAATSRRTSAPLAAAAGDFLMCDIVFILRGTAFGLGLPPRANARAGGRLQRSPRPFKARAAQRG